MSVPAPQVSSYRQIEILALLRQSGRVGVEELAQQFGVTLQTIVENRAAHHLAVAKSRCRAGIFRLKASRRRLQPPRRAFLSCRQLWPSGWRGPMAHRRADFCAMQNLQPSLAAISRLA